MSQIEYARPPNKGPTKIEETFTLSSLTRTNSVVYRLVADGSPTGNGLTLEGSVTDEQLLSPYEKGKKMSNENEGQIVTDTSAVGFQLEGNKIMPYWVLGIVAVLACCVQLISMA